MIIKRSLDIEDVVREALEQHFTIYCRPLPKNFELPSLLVTAVGGSSEEKQIDAFEVVLDSRATTDKEAMDLLLDATATLEVIAHSQTTPLRWVVQTSIGGWGVDPVRPELSMCSARMTIYAHREDKEIN